jgi:hypothetical protein
MGRQAADRFAALLEADSRREVSRGYHEDSEPRTAEHPGLLNCRNPGAMECPRSDTLHTPTVAIGVDGIVTTRGRFVPRLDDDAPVTG